jgi:Uncharacterized protein conserved in bacteria
MNTCRKSSTPLPTADISEIRRQSMGRFFGFCIKSSRENAGLSVEDAARLSGMELSRWMAIEDGYVPQRLNQLRAMAEALQIKFDVMAGWVLTCRAAWEC